MTGNEKYINQIKNKLECLIENNPDKKYLNGFINYISTNSAYSTVYTYASYVVAFMNENGKHPQDLTFDDYTNRMSNIKDNVSSYQITTYAALKRFSEYLCKVGINNRNPMKDIQRPKFKESISTRKKRNIGYLESEEIKEYIDNIKTARCFSGKQKEQVLAWKERDLAIVLILLNTGMRCSALYKLDIDSIDFKNKTLITIDKEQETEEHYLLDETIEAIENWIIKRDSILNGVHTNALFISNRKERMDQCSIARVVKKHSTTIEGKNITPHKLRATYGTQIYKNSGDLFLVQQCMNHKSPKTSELYIRGVQNDNRKRGTKIIGSLIGEM